MKRKIFIPHSLPFLLLLLFMCTFSAVSIMAFIWGVSGDIEVEMYTIPIVLFGVLFLIYSTLRIIFATIICLTSNSIYKTSDLLPKHEKIQFKCNIDYNQIKNVSIVASEKNSKNKKIKLRWASSQMPKKYLEFSLIDNKKERVLINYYTRNQIVKLLTIINNNLQKLNSPYSLPIDEIMKDWYTYGGYNRENLKIKRDKNHK